MACLGAALSLTLAGAGAVRAADKGDKKPRGTFQAHRAGWMLGMYVGEEKGQPFPFILQVDEKSDAKLKGIRAGDELIKFDNLDTNLSLQRVFDRANELRPGKMITVWVRRGSQTLRMELRVPRDPGASAEASAKKEGDKDAEATDEKDKKKKKKDRPVVIKPIPSPGNP